MGDDTRGASSAPIQDAERAVRWGLWHTKGVGAKRMARMVTAADGELANLLDVGSARARKVLAPAGLPKQCFERVIAALANKKTADAYRAELAALPASTRLIHCTDPGYPRRLMALDDPPIFVYVRGDIDWLKTRPTVAIVGSRKASVAGVRLARNLAGGLAEAGVATISGGALGVDAGAHRGCLAADMTTIAVLAGGVDRPTPRRNRDVFAEAVDKGGLLSEYPLGVRPRRYHFQRRNELIAALGDATIVVRAGRQSGTMITARAASDIGRPVCAMPGSLDNALCDGCHQLLVDGARCIRDATDVLDQIFDGTEQPPRQMTLAAGPSSPNTTDAARAASGIHSPAEAATKNGTSTPLPTTLSSDAEVLARRLRALAGPGGSGVERDALGGELGWDVGRLSSALLELELAGVARKRPGADVFEPR